MALEVIKRPFVRLVKWYGKPWHASFLTAAIFLIVAIVTAITGNITYAVIDVVGFSMWMNAGFTFLRLHWQQQLIDVMFDIVKDMSKDSHRHMAAVVRQDDFANRN